MWFVTQVMTGREEEVRQLCVARGVCSQKDVFYFQSEQQKKIKGEMERVLRPLFPGYLFFEVAETQAVSELEQRLRQVPAMTKLLSAGEDIVSVYPEKENLLRILGGDDHVIDVSRGIIEGDVVKVLQGPLKGKEAQIKRIDRHKRKALLEVHLFNRTVDMPVGLEIVRKV